MEGAGSATDITAISTELQQLLAELRSDPALSDVGKEFQRIATAMLATNAEEKKIAEQAKQTFAEIEVVRRATAEHRGATLDLQAVHSDLTVGTTKLSAELAEATKRVAVQVSAHDALTAALEGHAARLAVGSGWTPEQLSKQRELKDAVAEAHTVLDSKRLVVSALRRDVDVLQQAVERGEKARAELQAEMAGVQDDTQATIAKAQKLSGQQQKQAVELKEVQALVDHTQRRLREKEEAVAQGDDLIAKSGTFIKSRKQVLDKVLQEYNALHAETGSLTDTLDAQMSTNEGLVRDLRKIESRTGEYRTEAQTLAAEAARSAALHALASSKLEEASLAIHEVEEEAISLTSQIADARAEIAKQSSANEMLLRQQSDLHKERDILRSSLESLADKGVEVETIITMQYNSQKMSETSLGILRRTVKNLREQIDDTTDELVRQTDAVEDAQRQVQSVQEQITLQEVQEKALMKKSVLLGAKLKQQQGMYETARNEKNSYSKSLIEVEAEISKITLEFRGMTKSIDSLKDEITLKDQALVREHFGHHKVEKEKETIKSESMRVKRQITSCEEIASSQFAENAKLVSVVSRGDDERTRQQKEFQSVVTERDTLRAQVTQRDAELSALYEKLKIQRSTLEKSAATYKSQKEVETATLATLRKVQSDLSLAKIQVTSVDTLRQEIIHLEKLIREESTKTTALTLESDRPMNIHRWRQLESSNPLLYEKIFKVQTLQRRLIQTTEDIAQREALTREKEALFQDLKTVLDRQPSSDAMEHVVMLQQQLKQKQRQLKSMEEELDAVKETVRDNKYELELIGAQIDKAERAYLARAKAAAAGAFTGQE